MPHPPVVFFILGGPGSGKGANCERLSKEFNLIHISAGDLLREEAKKETDLAKKIRDILAAGQIVPSEVTVELLFHKISDLNTPSIQGFLIDGFPRKLDQAKMFEDSIAVAKGILYLDCSEQTMEDRLIKRAQGGSTRSDDANIDVIRKRFRVNIEQCMPVVEKYKADGRLTLIDANKSFEAVYEQCRHFMVSGAGLHPTAVGGGGGGASSAPAAEAKK